MATVTKSIGTTGRDYSTITLWEADLDNAAEYSASDDAVGECYNDSVFTENVTIDGGGTIGLSSIKLTVPEAERHDGTAGTGVRITQGGAGTIFEVDQSNVTVEWIEISQGSDVNNSTGLYGGQTSQTGNTISKCIVHDVGRSSAATISHGIRVITGGTQVNVLNNIVYDIYKDGTATGNMYGMFMDHGGPTSYIMNNTVFNTNSTSSGSVTAYGISYDRDDADVIGRNNIAMDTSADVGSASDFNWAGTTNVDTDYQLSSDASGDDDGNSNSVISVASGDQFVSTTGGSENLHLKDGSDAIGVGEDRGTTPTDVNIDIDGRDRDAEGDTWDMGADRDWETN